MRSSWLRGARYNDRSTLAGRDSSHGFVNKKVYLRTTTRSAARWPSWRHDYCNAHERSRKRMTRWCVLVMVALVCINVVPLRVATVLGSASPSLNRYTGRASRADDVRDYTGYVKDDVTGLTWRHYLCACATLALLEQCDLHGDQGRSAFLRKHDVQNVQNSNFPSHSGILTSPI